ncbi:MAG: hypothetical protein U5N86_08040 [Planctomycetota bacterium]|nr:hypothetical protein [Planctomycetota bacterium]
MAHFELPQNKKKRLFTGPETKSPNKLLAVVGLLALFGLAGLLGSYYFQNKKPDDGAITVPSASPGTTTTEPVATPPPMPTGTYIDNRIRPKTELNSEILADVTDTYDKTSGHMPIEEAFSG